MKIFWSWQSDTPGKIGRFLIQDALQAAIEKLKEAPEIEEPTKSETREALELDHDIRGTSGSPDLARTILQKIEKARVVVSDVTPVGFVSNVDALPSSKKLINSNVAMELGYAFKALGDENVLLVLNKHYGSHEELPFDLRHKGGAVVFDLAPNATREQRQAVEKQLAGDFVRALRPFLEQTAAVSTPIVTGTASTFNRAAYFPQGQVLAVALAGNDLRYTTKDFCYLRLIPLVQGREPKALKTLKQTAHRAPLLSRNYGVHVDHNEYGAIAVETSYYAIDAPPVLEASTQLFPSGEVWFLNGGMIVREASDGHPASLKYPFLPMEKFESSYLKCVESLTDFMTKELQVNSPWQVELGLAGIKDLHLPAPGTGSYFRQFWGPIRVPEIYIQRRLNEPNTTALKELLLEYFERVWDAAGQKRPRNLYGFPEQA